MTQQQSNPFSILNTVLATLVKTSPNTEPLLGLSVIDGPYTGVVFVFTKFTVQNERLENGMVPAKFDIQVFKAPEGFVQDEAFEEYVREVLLAWLGYISTHSFSALLQTDAVKGVH